MAPWRVDFGADGAIARLIICRSMQFHRRSPHSIFTRPVICAGLLTRILGPQLSRFLPSCGRARTLNLCAKTGREQLQQDVLTEFLLAGLHGGQVRGLFAPKNAQRSGKPI